MEVAMHQGSCCCQPTFRMAEYRLSRQTLSFVVIRSSYLRVLYVCGRRRLDQMLGYKKVGAAFLSTHLAQRAEASEPHRVVSDHARRGGAAPPAELDTQRGRAPHIVFPGFPLESTLAPLRIKYPNISKPQSPTTRTPKSLGIPPTRRLGARRSRSYWGSDRKLWWVTVLSNLSPQPRYTLGH